MSEGGEMSAPNPVGRLQELLERLEDARRRLERTEDPDTAVQILRELADLAKDVQGEIERARRDEGRADA